SKSRRKETQPGIKDPKREPPVPILTRKEYPSLHLVYYNKKYYFNEVLHSLF
ncbi:6453_t:CDS:1, partial [Rhizophagus irregularis]